MTDQDHADAVRKAARALNDAILEATCEGLLITLDTHTDTEILGKHPAPGVYPAVMRPLR